MLVLLGVSTLLASQAPQQQRGEDAQETDADADAATADSGGARSEPATPGATQPSAGPGSAGPKRLPAGVPCVPGKLCATIEADPERISVVQVRLGEQLALTVRSPGATDLVEIPALGLIDSAEPFKPANFDLLATRAGDFGIRLVEADRLVGRIEVRRRGSKAKPGAGSESRPG